MSLIFLFFSLLQLAFASEHHQVAKNLVIKADYEGAPPDRLTKRGESPTFSVAAHGKLALPSQLSVSFSAYDKQFTLKLRRTETLLAPDFRVVLLDEQGNERPVEEAFSGHPYTATQIISDSNVNEPLNDPFARFHVQKTGDTFEVQGSFEWQGALFRLRPSHHPVADALLKSTNQEDLLVSREWMDERRLLEKGAFGSGFLAAKNATVAFKC